MQDIGEKLRNSRITNKLTIRDINRKTHIKELYIRAIERGEWELIPNNKTFILPYLKLYARTLGRDDLINDNSIRGIKQKLNSLYSPEYNNNCLVSHGKGRKKKCRRRDSLYIIILATSTLSLIAASIYTIIYRITTP